MRVQVCRWGKSVAVRIPAPTLRAAGLQVGQSLELRVEGGCLVLEPVVDGLDVLLANVTPQNRHGLELMGPPVGVES